jgi:DNA-binding CsgD family transcriptional regulator
MTLGMNPALMQKAAVKTAASAEGFLLLNSSMNPIFVNSAAAEILSYPQKPETQKNLHEFLAGKISSTLLLRSSCGPALVAKFQSGRRFYQCRSYRVNALANGGSQASVAVLLERGPRASSSLVEISERFRLTVREQEVVQHLTEGLTTKEIATRLQISPHTVKAFLRLIMVKMGVSTRSGIVGKAFSRSLPAYGA